MSSVQDAARVVVNFLGWRTGIAAPRMEETTEDKPSNGRPCDYVQRRRRPFWLANNFSFSPPPCLQPLLSSPLCGGSACLQSARTRPQRTSEVQGLAACSSRHVLRWRHLMEPCAVVSSLGICGSFFGSASPTADPQRASALGYQRPSSNLSMDVKRVTECYRKAWGSVSSGLSTPCEEDML